MAIFRKGPEPRALAVAMAGVRMGDRLLQIGFADRLLLGALASKVGLSGRAAAAVPSESTAAAARDAAARAGVLVEVEVGPLQRLPFQANAFDLAVIDSTANLIGTMRPEDRVGCLQEVFRVLRPGGRVVVIETAPRGGLGALFARRAVGPHYRATGGAKTALRAEGFKGARILAEREGLVFFEAVKPGA